MTAVLEVTRRISVRSGDGTLLDYGSITTPIQTACAGVPIRQPTTITLAAGASATLWDYTVDGSFVAFFAECSGFAWIEQTVDAPTSSTDFTAAGTAVNHPKDGLSCVAPWIAQGMVVPVVASSSNYAGSAFHASTANGRRYKITVKNPGATAVTITFGWTL